MIFPHERECRQVTTETCLRCVLVSSHHAVREDYTFVGNDDAMKITFVRPSMNGLPCSVAMEPLVFALLAARTPADVETVLYDECLEPIPFDEPTDLAAITVETFTAQNAYQIAGQFRAA